MKRLGENGRRKRWVKLVLPKGGRESADPLGGIEVALTAYLQALQDESAMLVSCAPLPYPVPDGPAFVVHYLSDEAV